MKSAFRQSMAWLHTWAGLLVGWILFFMFLTGTAGYFDSEIDRWMRPERPLVENHLPTEQTIDVGLRRLQSVAPGAQRWFIAPPAGRESPDLRIFYRQPPVASADGKQAASGKPSASAKPGRDSKSRTNGKEGANGKSAANGSELLNPVTGQPLEYRETGGGQVLYRMHYALHYMPAIAAYWIVGACAMFMLVAILSGIIVHKKIFKDFFTFRPGKQQRSWLDAHNVLSVIALPFHLMITYSGLIFFALTYMPLIVTASYGSGEENLQVFVDEASGRETQVEPAGVAAPLAPLAPILAEAARRFGPDQVRSVEIRNPGDANARIAVARTLETPVRSSERLVFDGVRGTLLDSQKPVSNAPRAVRDIFLGLHEGLFAGPVLRWLYFLSGLLGAAMIATGLVLWTAKRRAQQAKQARPSFGLAMVERLNVGTIVGLPMSVVVYFWANRLIPASLEGRAEWEVHAMFIAWAVMLIHAFFRPLAKAWVEQLWIAAGVCVLLPVLNALTTERHLGVTLPNGDWVLAGFDLTILALGIAFACAAIKVRGVTRTAPLVKRIAERRSAAAQFAHTAHTSPTASTAHTESV